MPEACFLISRGTVVQQFNAPVLDFHATLLYHTSLLSLSDLLDTSARDPITLRHTFVVLLYNPSL